MFVLISYAKLLPKNNSEIVRQRQFLCDIWLRLLFLYFQNCTVSLRAIFGAFKIIFVMLWACSCVKVQLFFTQINKNCCSVQFLKKLLPNLDFFRIFQLQQTKFLQGNTVMASVVNVTLLYWNRNCLIALLYVTEHTGSWQHVATKSPALERLFARH